jgi:hypothetical protein
MNGRSLSLILLAMAAALAACCGCNRSTHSEHDHLEHHQPPHKPGSLPEAVIALEIRFSALPASGHVPSQAEVTLLRELLDIVRWLPETAGDSDLPEAEWNVVDSISGRLAPHLAEQLRRSERGEQVDLTPLAEPWSAALSQLREVADHESLRPAPPAADVASSDQGDEP